MSEPLDHALLVTVCQSGLPLPIGENFQSFAAVRSSGVVETREERVRLIFFFSLILHFHSLSLSICLASVLSRPLSLSLSHSFSLSLSHTNSHIHTLSLYSNPYFPHLIYSFQGIFSGDSFTGPQWLHARVHLSSSVSSSATPSSASSFNNPSSMPFFSPTSDYSIPFTFADVHGSILIIFFPFFSFLIDFSFFLTFFLPSIQVTND